MRRAGRWAAALLPVILGCALRLAYAVRADPFVDEPTTLLVAQAIARSGRPVLPSGLFYGNDLPFSYLAGALVALFGPHLLAIRLLSVAASTATLALLFLAGWRLFSFRAGLWAALLLALAPQEIVWGGRARAYALLGLLVLSAVWLFYEGIAASRPGPRRLGLFLLVVAVFVHPEAALVLPALALVPGLLHGPQAWLRPSLLAELALAAAGAAARYGLQLALAYGWIGDVQTLAGSRPPLQPAADLLVRLRAVAPFFLDLERLPWTALALAALGAAVRRPAAGRGPLGFVSLCLWLPPAAMVLLLGSTYASPRYLAMLLPVFALAAAAGLDRIVARVPPLTRLPSAATASPHRGEGKSNSLPLRHGAEVFSGGAASRIAAGLAVALLVGYLPAAVRAATTQEKGFQPALQFVAGHWQPGDRIATVAPAYSRLVLGRSDLFALGLEYEEFVFRAADGRLVDRWTASPLIRTADDLAAALAAGGRLWLVVDEGRFRQRFEPAFAQRVWERMELVAREQGVLVFVSDDRPPTAASHTVGVEFAGQVTLDRYELGARGAQPPDAVWGEVVARPGEALPLVLHWRATGPVTGEYTVFVHLLGVDGTRYAQGDGPPLYGRQPMAHWIAGETLRDRRALDLPADLPPGRYRLEIGLYDGSGNRLPIVDAVGRPAGEVLVLDYVRVPASGEAVPAPDRAVQADLSGNGDRVRLLGYSLEEGAGDEGEPVLALYWQAPAPIGADYTVFVHLLDAQGEIRGQGDGPPLDGFYPTSAWDPGEIVVDRHRISVEPGLPPGKYRLAAGLYRMPGNERLSAGGQDHVVLGEIEW